MILHITDVVYLDDYRIKLVFNDGLSGVADLRNALWGEMFEPLLDPNNFSQIRLNPELGTVSWPNGADLAPEFLYTLIQPKNEPNEN
ncbi:DUF2442 domain-containing protein [Methylotuvimicrobium buryatense]|uniref:DUF2442 domain-containing protein n=1 Tax=Methylotuvimicrobium buryatense TaxID=95641 RepID=A0A4P9UV61_METBY|nr:DUF2442 domain-containing protein [Methylotuvimicrobium buryatense]QCW84311.1 DUF2442 domain-containing protein [Methylotuvimicrobium buryatense]